MTAQQTQDEKKARQKRVEVLVRFGEHVEMGPKWIHAPKNSPEEGQWLECLLALHRTRWFKPYQHANEVRQVYHLGLWKNVDGHAANVPDHSSHDLESEERHGEG